MMVILSVLFGGMTGYAIYHPEEISSPAGFLIMAVCCLIMLLFQLLVYYKHPNRIIIDESGIRYYYRTFKFSAPFSFWKDCSMTYTWEMIGTVHLDWSESISRGLLYETWLVVENKLEGGYYLITLTKMTYNRKLLINAVNYFSEGRCSFDLGTTITNSKKRLKYILRGTILPILIGVIVTFLLCRILI